MRLRAVRRTPIEWRAEDLPVPEFTGVRVLDNFPLATLREFIDWTPFFHTWELKGVYPRIFDDARAGRAGTPDLHRSQCAARQDHREEPDHRARRLWALSRQRRRRRRRAVHGRHARRRCSTRFHFLRQQAKQRRQRALPVAGRLHRAEGNRAARSHRRFRGDQRHRTEGTLRPLPRRA